jgi:iron complex transport system substrate-binding protein
MRIFLFPFVFLIFACSTRSVETKVDLESSAVNTVSHAKHFRFGVTENGAQIVEIIHPDSKKVVAILHPLQDNKSVIALSGTFIGMMDKLHLVDNISGVSEIKYVYNKTIIENFKNKKVVEVGYDTQLALESIISSKPALILHSGYSAEFPHEKQIENLGIQCIPIYDWREETPLGKAEWIKVYGFLYGKLDEAIKQFSAIQDRYNKLKDKVKELSPSELVMSGNIIGSEWYCPAGESFFSELLRDANITYNYFDSKGTGSTVLTQEKILSENRHAAIWINPGIASLKELKMLNPKVALFDAFNNGAVYCHSHNENFYWEISAIEPDRLLSDLIQIAHPEYNSKGKLYFYAKLR